MAVDDAGDGVGEVGERIDAVELAGLDQGGDDGPVFRAAVGAGEEGILAGQGHPPFILPMSAKRLKFITAGTPISARKFAFGVSNGER